MRKDRELEIIHELAEKVLPFSEAISEACDICAELDCLLCFAEATNQYNYRRPQMSEENVINIKQGRYGVFSVFPQYYRSPVADCFFYIYRHPLQEQTVDTFVPNDILIVGGAGIGSYPAVHGEGDDLMSEGSVRGNSVVICTGANACGKVKKISILVPPFRTYRMHASNVL
jgi:DNA mismatch repair protein MSH5